MSWCADFEFRVTHSGRPMSFLVIDSATVVYKMNWMTGEHLQAKPAPPPPPPHFDRDRLVPASGAWYRPAVAYNCLRGAVG